MFELDLNLREFRTQAKSLHFFGAVRTGAVAWKPPSNAAAATGARAAAARRAKLAIDKFADGAIVVPQVRRHDRRVVRGQEARRRRSRPRRSSSISATSRRSRRSASASGSTSSPTVGKQRRADRPDRVRAEGRRPAQHGRELRRRRAACSASTRRSAATTATPSTACCSRSIATTRRSRR